MATMNSAPADMLISIEGGPNMRAKPGDRLVIKGHRVGEDEKSAEILEVKGDHDTARYLVRWGDGHEGWIYPGNDAVVEHPKKARPR
jgi:hypothetical protein